MAMKLRNIADFESYNIPILYLNGETGGMSKEEAVTLNYNFRERSGSCTLKWQGSSSITYDKKNFTIKFDNDFEVVSGWGAQKKYVLKANFIDHSHARNLTSAKLWGQIVKSRTTPNATLNALVNGGAVDGFPIVLSINGKFYGLYTWNIPKDDWLFGMSGTGQQAIVCADYNSDAVKFNGLADFVDDFELEYSSDDQSAWVLESLNRLIGAVKDSDGTNIQYGITPYIDWDSAIDYYIHTVLTTGVDGLTKNYILATYDGVKWFFSAYDMDSTFGLYPIQPFKFVSAISNMTFKGFTTHKLFSLIWTYMRPQLRARYNAIRELIMSEDNVSTELYNFVSSIPKPILDEDVKLWQRIPLSETSNINQMLNHYRIRVGYTDEWIKDTSGETALPEQVNPEPEEPNEPAYVNQVPISIDTNGSVFNGKGWIGSTRLSSSGVTKASGGASVTGYIPASSGCVIHIHSTDERATWLSPDQQSANYVCAYNSSFKFVCAQNCTSGYNGGTVGGDTTEATVTLPTNSDIAYVRVSLSRNTGTDIGEDGPGQYMIVTVNQDIVS